VESKKILGASLGTCVHVAGVYGFLTLAERFGYQTVFLGPARSPQEVVEAALQERPSMVIVGYRLTERVAEKLFEELQSLITRHGLFRIPWALSCTPQIEPVARKSGLFTYIFTGREPFSEIVASLTGSREERREDTYPETLPGRIAARYPFPLLRHHFGLPTVEETVEGVRRISEAKVVDIISLGPDQNAQEFVLRTSQDGRNPQRSRGSSPAAKRRPRGHIRSLSKGEFPPPSLLQRNKSPQGVGTPSPRNHPHRLGGSPHLLVQRARWTVKTATP